MNWPALGAIASLFLAPPAGALGQEAVRQSLAGEAAAEARHRVATSPEGCNFRLGQTSWNLGAELDFEANDNIQFVPARAEGDLTIRPQVTAQMAWPITEKNSVNLSLGTGYSAYVVHPRYSRFFIGPGSELSFDLYAADVWLNLHERFSITANAYQDPTVVGTADYSQLQNDAGVLATWDLNKLIMKLGYDHANYAALTGGTGVPDGASETASVSLGCRIEPELSAGLEAGGGLIQYSGASAGAPEATDWNGGLFLEAQPLEYVRFKASGGYTVYAPQTMGGFTSSGEFTGAYARLALNHRLNQFVEYAFSGGRNISFGFFGGTIDLYSAVLTAQWRLFRKLGLSSWFEFDHGSQVLFGREHFDRFGPGVGLDRSITRILSGSVRYQYYQRGSNLPGGDYAVNIITLSLVVRL